MPQQLPHTLRARRGARGRGGRTAPLALRRPGAPGRARLSRPRLRAGPGAARRGRGTLHLAVGQRLPPQLPAHSCVHRRAASPASRDGAHGNGHAPGARGHRKLAWPARPAARGGKLRPPQPHLPRRAPAGAGRQEPRAAWLCARTRRALGHRVLLESACRGGGLRPAMRARPRRHALPRRAHARGTRCQPGRLPLRPQDRDGGHQRLWHGHRQEQRELRRPLQPANVTRELLPGGWPRRARRHEGRMSVALFGIRRPYRRVSPREDRA